MLIQHLYVFPDYYFNEVTMDYNAGFQSLLAGLRKKVCPWAGSPIVQQLPGTNLIKKLVYRSYASLIGQKNSNDFLSCSNWLNLSMAKLLCSEFFIRLGPVFYQLYIPRVSNSFLKSVFKPLSVATRNGVFFLLRLVWLKINFQTKSADKYFPGRPSVDG